MSVVLNGICRCVWAISSCKSSGNAVRISHSFTRDRNCWQHASGAADNFRFYQGLMPTAVLPPCYHTFDFLRSLDWIVRTSHAIEACRSSQCSHRCLSVAVCNPSVNAHMCRSTFAIESTGLVCRCGPSQAGRAHRLQLLDGASVIL